MASTLTFIEVLENIGDAAVLLGHNAGILSVVWENMSALFEDQTENVVSSLVTNDEINDTLTMLMNIMFYTKNTTTRVSEVTHINKNLIRNIQEKAQALTEQVNINEFSARNLERMETIERSCNHILLLVDRRDLQILGTGVSKQCFN